MLNTVRENEEREAELGLQDSGKLVCLNGVFASNY